MISMPDKKKKKGGEIKHLIRDLFMPKINESGYFAGFKIKPWKEVMLSCISKPEELNSALNSESPHD